MNIPIGGEDLEKGQAAVAASSPFAGEIPMEAGLEGARGR